MGYIAWWVEKWVDGAWEPVGHRKTQAGAESLLERKAYRPIYGFKKTGEAYGSPILEVHGFRIIRGWVSDRK